MSGAAPAPAPAFGQGADRLDSGIDTYRGPEALLWVARGLLVVPMMLALVDQFVFYGGMLGGSLSIFGASVRMAWDLPAVFRDPWAAYGYGAPVYQLVPFLGGLAVALWIGALISSFRGAVTETGACMVGFSVVSVGAGLYSIGSLEAYVRYWPGWPALLAAGVIAAVGIVLIVVGGQRRMALAGVPTDTARAIWSAERRQASPVTTFGIQPPPPPPPAGAGPGWVPPSAPLAPQAPVVEYATWGIRLAARLIDGIFCLFVFVPILAAVTAGIAAATGTDVVFALIFALYVDMALWELAYYLVGASHGQTVGKRAMGIRVCRETGERLGFWLALGRQFASLISSLALAIGWFAPLWTPKRQTWHDSMTGTIVIRDPAARAFVPAIVWGVVWTVLTAVGVGFGASSLWDSIDGGSYDWEYDYSGEYYDDSSYEDGYCDYSRYDDPDC